MSNYQLAINNEQLVLKVFRMQWGVVKLKGVLN